MSKILGIFLILAAFTGVSEPVFAGSGGVTMVNGKLILKPGMVFQKTSRSTGIVKTFDNYGRQSTVEVSCMSMGCNSPACCDVIVTGNVTYCHCDDGTEGACKMSLVDIGTQH